MIISWLALSLAVVSFGLSVGSLYWKRSVKGTDN